MKMYASIALTALVGLFTGCHSPKQPPLSRSALAVHRLDTNAPLSFWFGRGSGMSGLDSIILDGTNEVYTVTDSNRKHHRLAATLEPGEVAAGMNYFGILVLADEYIDTNFVDGTQWVLVVKQGGIQKRIYCSNQFPIELQHFASWLDGKALGLFKLADSTLRPMLADAISREEYRRFSDEIWDAARRIEAFPDTGIPCSKR